MEESRSYCSDYDRSDSLFYVKMQDTKTNIFVLTKQDTAVLKGIAIIAMLMHRLWDCPPKGIEPYTGVLGFFGSVGKVCVAMFLFCSGYGLSAGYSRLIEDCRLNSEDWKNEVKETLKFLAKRFVKFYAGYWPIFLIFVPISIFGFGRALMDAYGTDSNVYQCLMYDVLGIGRFQSYNITWWFNALIIGLYLLFPAIYLLSRKSPWLLLILSLLIVRLGGRGWDGMLSIIMLYQMPFVSGILWKKWEGIGDAFVGKEWLWAIGCVVVLTIATICREQELIPHWSGARMDGLIAIAMAGLVIVCRKCGNINTALAYCGKHSMNIYLMHTFFMGYWFESWFYECEVREITKLITILITCLATSICIELIKDTINWNKLMDKTCQKLA